MDEDCRNLLKGNTRASWLANQKPRSEASFGHFGTVGLGPTVVGPPCRDAQPPRSARASRAGPGSSRSAVRRARSPRARTRSGAPPPSRPRGGRPSRAPDGRPRSARSRRRTPTRTARARRRPPRRPRRPPRGRRPGRRAGRPRRRPRTRRSARGRDRRCRAPRRRAGTGGDRDRSPALRPALRLGTTSAWTSTASASPARQRRAPWRRRARPRPGAGGRPGRSRAGPAPVISNQATSPSAPNRFLPAESIRSPERGIAVERQDDVDGVLERRGPARSPVLGDVAGHQDRDPLGLGEPDQRVRAPANLRRAAPAPDPPTDRGAPGSNRPRAGRAVRTERPRPRRAARDPTRTTGSSRRSRAGARGPRPDGATPRRTRTGRGARRPTGSPPSGGEGSTCRCRAPPRAGPPSTARARRRGRDRCRADPVETRRSSASSWRERLERRVRGGRARTPPSSIVPQAPQPGHRPAHCASCWPHSRHDRTVRTLPMEEP